MSEYRYDPLSSRWVIVAANRAARPDEFHVPPVRRVASRCPFCAGNEADTPGTLAIYPAAAGSNWHVRVVANLYPAVELTARQLKTDGTVGWTPRPSDLPNHNWTDEASILREPSAELFPRRAGVGVHEVIIESATHEASFGALSDEVVTSTLRAYRDRVLAARDVAGIVAAQLFKNVGFAAGASIEHGHSQLIALPFVPHDLEVELSNSLTWFHQRQQCLLCSLVAAELQAETRIVARSKRFVAYCPFASRFAYETWIVPLDHHSHFEQVDDGLLLELALFQRDIARRVEHVGQGSGYNFLLHTMPWLESAPSISKTLHAPHFHWHWELFPRLSSVAGFEWGSGHFINTTSPESAAERLRNCRMRS